MAPRKERATPVVDDEPDAGRVLLELPRGRGQVLRVAVREFDGRELLDLRLWFWSEPDGGSETLMPTRKGVSLRLEQLDALRAALNGLAAELAQSGAADTPVAAAASLQSKITHS